MKNPTFWCKSQLQQASARREMDNIVATSVDLHLFFSQTIKSNDLGLLTHVAGKSAPRRSLPCDSQLLTPNISQEMADSRFYLARRLLGKIV